ncbi:MAG TPA: hypothetical protein VG326_03250 [Tepidisphaeraceae bacterium]|jgi:hypothetical protein|nr:hypothetical protein [Tepidisphaeraceae bacterium]
MKNFAWSLAALIGILIVSTCAAAAPDAPSASPADVDAIKHVLTIADTLPRDAAPLHAALAEAANKITDAALRQRIQNLLPDLETAAGRHARSQTVVANLKAINGLSELSPGGPAWLRSIVGDQAMRVFDRLTLVDLNERKNPHAKDYKLNTAINDQWLAQLQGLTDIRRLDIANVAIKGPGLKYVGTLTNLESINLTLTPVTDEYLEPLRDLTELKTLGLASAECNGVGCKYLHKLTKLENLNFHHTPVNDEGLKEICQMTSLERLEIVHTFFTDAGAMNLANLKNLQRLQLGSRKATGAAVGYLRNLPKLRELDLHDLSNAGEAVRLASEIPTLTVLRVYVGPINDDDLKSVSRLARLQELVLEGSKITDAGIDSLAATTKLKKLSLGHAKISPAAIDKLKAALPGLEIIP